MNDCESTYNFNTHKEVINVLRKNSNKNVLNFFLNYLLLSIYIYVYFNSCMQIEFYYQSNTSTLVFANGFS